MNNSAPIIRTYDLTKRFGKATAVDRINFSVNRGEIFGLLGPNGAGKTTTIAMLLGLVRPTSGSAEVLGHNIRHDLNVALRQVGALVETPAFYPYISGADNLRFFARLIGSNAEQTIPDIIERIGLKGREKDKVGTYSLGMRQRLGIGLALLGNSELLILDEPTNGLDPKGKEEMRILMRYLADREGKTILLSSHILHEVEQICDRVLILKMGRVVALGTVSELLSRTQGVEIRIDEIEKAAQVLGQLDWVRSTCRAGDYLIVQAPPERAPELLAALASHALFPYEVRPLTATLESVFLDLTKESDAARA